MSEDNNEDRSGRVEHQLVRVEIRLGRVEARLGGVENRLANIESRLVKTECRSDRVDDRLGRVGTDIVELKGKVNSLFTELKDFKTDVAKEFGAVRVEMIALARR